MNIKNVNIKIVYFAYLIPNVWENIIIEQLQCLYNLTTLYETATIYMCAIDDTKNMTEVPKLNKILEKYPKIILKVSPHNLFEYFGITQVYELSSNNAHEYILYFHSKGMMSKLHSIRHLLYQYTIKNYANILEEMENNLEIDVSSLIPAINGFAYYNFFWARSSYINKYCSQPNSSISYTKYGRFTWEMWLGNHFSNKKIVNTYSPILKYNSVYEEVGATFLMNLFLSNSFPNLADPIIFNETMKLHIKPMSLIVDNSLTDKNTAHTYIDLYDTLFTPIRANASNILEVGIYHGGSIQLWCDFFPRAHIYGVDICNLDFIKKESIKTDHNITLYTNTNAYDNNFIKEHFINKNIYFDMILDDGPHTLQSNIDLILLYSQLLTKNGIIVIEDIQNINYINILIENVPINLKKYIQVFDLRYLNNRYDNIVFVINKNI